MEIEVGEWVRTKDGRIYKVDDFSHEWILNDVFYKVIAKHSKNKIDLIQEGDYVNGMLVVSVIELDKESNYIPTRIVFVNRDEKCTLPPLKIYNNDIKSIVTKEQFSSVEYLLEEE